MFFFVLFSVMLPQKFFDRRTLTQKSRFGWYGCSLLFLTRPLSRWPFGKSGVMDIRSGKLVELFLDFRISSSWCVIRMLHNLVEPTRHWSHFFCRSLDSLHVGLRLILRLVGSVDRFLCFLSFLRFLLWLVLDEGGREVGRGVALVVEEGLDRGSNSRCGVICSSSKISASFNGEREAIKSGVEGHLTVSISGVLIGECSSWRKIPSSTVEGMSAVLVWKETLIPMKK